MADARSGTHGRQPGTAGPKKNASRKRKVPWARRIVSTLVLVAVLVGLVFGLVKAGSWVHSLLSEQHAKTTEAATPKPVTINACEGNDLSVTVTPSAAVLPEGQGMEVTVQAENRGDADCTVAMSSVSVELVGPAGSVWTPTACSTSWGKTLLLGSGKSWSATLTWDGLLYSECEPVRVGDAGATPSAGSYTLKWAGPDTASGSAALQIQ